MVCKVKDINRTVEEDVFIAGTTIYFILNEWDVKYMKKVRNLTPVSVG